MMGRKKIVIVIMAIKKLTIEDIQCLKLYLYILNVRTPSGVTWKADHTSRVGGGELPLLISYILYSIYYICICPIYRSIQRDGKYEQQLITTQSQMLRRRWCSLPAKFWCLKLLQDISNEPLQPKRSTLVQHLRLCLIREYSNFL